MKGDRKVRKILITVGIVLVLVLALTAPVYAASPISKTQVKVQMIPAGQMFASYGDQGAGAKGKVVMTQLAKVKGSGSKANFGISAEGLEGNSSYDVLIDLDGITPGEDSTIGLAWDSFGTFATDAYGNGQLSCTVTAGAGTWTIALFIVPQYSDPGGAVLISYNITLTT
jgi:hypothetical protein